MHLNTKLIIFSLFYIIIKETTADGKHPYGRGETLVNIGRNGDIAEFVANKDFIEKIFSHPQVRDRKIVVFSIIGAYRQGKSFFLDYCLRYLYATYGSINTNVTEITPSNDWLGGKTEPLLGFSWKHGTKADTKGLMIWSDVFLYDAPDGEKIAIVIIDTQGLFERGSNEEENAKIFSFSTLVSSIQIINIKDRIQENQITHFQTAIELTNLITMKQQGYSKKKPFQILIFLLRDFQDEKFELGYEGGKEYFEYFFEDLVENNDQEPENSARINEGESRAKINRNSIKESFEKIFLFLLNSPGELIWQSHGEWGKLDKTFVKNLRFLIESLLAPEKLVKKVLLGSEMTGEKFKEILIALCESYSSYKVPPADGIYQIAINSQMSAIVKEKVKNYKAAMTSEMLDFDRTDFVEWLQRKHNVTLNQAVNEFLKAEKIEDKLSEEKFIKILNNEINEFFETFKKSTLKSYTVFKTEKEMQAMVFQKSVEYRSKLNQDIDYEAQDFEQLIILKHHNLMKTIEMEFKEFAKIYNDTIRSEKFAQNLKDEIEKVFQIWKDSALKRHTEIRLKILANSELEAYRQNINNISDFDQEDFETKIIENHLQLKAAAIEEFLNATGDNFEAEIVEKTKKFLESEINIAFRGIKASKTETYQIYKERNNLEVDVFLNQLVKRQLQVFENNFISSIAYETENFEKELLITFVKSRKVAIDDFIAATNKAEYSLKKGESFDILVEKIQNFFEAFKITAIAENEKMSSKRVQEIYLLLDEKFSEFKRKVGIKRYNDTDFAKDSFEIDIRNYFEEARNEIVENFKLSANESPYLISLRCFTNELNDKIDSHYQVWRAQILDLKLYFDLKQKQVIGLKISDISHKMLTQYKTEMEEKKIRLNTEFSLLTAHDLAKNTAINSFIEMSLELKDLTLLEKEQKELERRIAEAFDTIKIDKKDEIKKLETDGIWVSWNSSMKDFPFNAVISGNYNGGGCAVSRFDGNAGEWCIKEKNATTVSRGRVMYSQTFEILRHTKWKYIQCQGNGTPITNNGEKICRHEYEDGSKHHGRFDDHNKCQQLQYVHGRPRAEWWQTNCQTLVLNN